MFVLFTSDPLLARTLVTLPGLDMEVTSQARNCWRATARASALVVDLDCAAVDDRFRRALREFTLDPVSPPLLVVCRDPLDHLGLILPASIHSVIPRGRWDELRRALDTARHDVYLNRALSRLRDGGTLPTALLRALEALMTSFVPPDSIGALARAAGCDVSTLYRDLARVTGARADLSPKEIHDWVVLLRARSLKVAGRSWDRVARLLSTTRRTLDRICRRLFDLSLGQWAALPPWETTRGFEERVLLNLMPARAEKNRHKSQGNDIDLKDVRGVG